VPVRGRRWGREVIVRTVGGGRPGCQRSHLRCGLRRAPPAAPMPRPTAEPSPIAAQRPTVSPRTLRLSRTRRALSGAPPGRPRRARPAQAPAAAPIGIGAPRAEATAQMAPNGSALSPAAVRTISWECLPRRHLLEPRRPPGAAEALRSKTREAQRRLGGPRATPARQEWQEWQEWEEWGMATRRRSGGARCVGSPGSALGCWPEGGCGPAWRRAATGRADRGAGACGTRA